MCCEKDVRSLCSCCYLATFSSCLEIFFDGNVNVSLSVRDILICHCLFKQRKHRVLGAEEVRQEVGKEEFAWKEN